MAEPRLASPVPRRLRLPQFEIANWEPSQRWIAAAAWIAVACGVAMHLIHYFGGRPLWLDELMVSLNIERLSARELAGRLDYDQVAPYGWLLLEKLCSRLPLPPEYGLRLPSLAAAIGAVVLFRSLAFRALGGGLAALAAVMLFAFSPAVVRYAAEVKPYGLDAFFSVLILWFAVDLMRRDNPASAGLAGLFAAGLAAVVLTLPSVFVLASAGGLLFLQRLTRRRWGEASALALIGLVWAAVFAALYLQIYQPASAGTEMTNGYSAQFFNDEAFAPLPPRSLSDVAWYFGWAVRTIVYFFHQDSRFPAALALAAGLVCLALRWSWVAALICAAPAIALVASGLHVYPLFDRLLQFMTPHLLLLAGAGVGWVAARSKTPVTPWAVLLALCVAGGVPTLEGNLRARPPYGIQNVEPALSTLNRLRRPGDVLYVSNQAIPAHLFYKARYGLSDLAWTPGKAVEVSWSCFLQDIARAAPKGRVWVLIYSVGDPAPPPQEALPLALAAHGWAGQPKLAASGWNVWLYELPRQPLPGGDHAPPLWCGLTGKLLRFDAPPRIASRGG